MLASVLLVDLFIKEDQNFKNVEINVVVGDYSREVGTNPVFLSDRMNKEGDNGNILHTSSPTNMETNSDDTKTKTNRNPKNVSVDRVSVKKINNVLKKRNNSSNREAAVNIEIFDTNVNEVFIYDTGIINLNSIRIGKCRGRRCLK